MAKKFDTNPLDPDFPEKARKAAKAVETAEQPPSNGSRTRPFADPLDTEHQTRRFADTGFASEAAPTGLMAEVEESRPANRQVDRVGLPENLLVALPYVPFYIGLIAGILELLFVPKSEAKVRFHAAQGLAAHLGILIVTTILGFASIATDLADVASIIFQIVTFVMLIVFTVKAWKGEPVHIETVESLTDWLEEKISPRK